MNTTTLIFDFDGTLADSHSYLIKISNRLADEFNFKKIPPEKSEEFKQYTAKEMIDILNVPLLKIPAIVAKGKKEFYKDISSVKPFEGIKNALEELLNLNIKLGILSSNSMENISSFLEKHKMNHFDFIHTTSKVWSKNTTLKKIIKVKKLSLDQIIYIGDEARDITAAQKIGVKVAAVTWGYNSKNTLKKFNPDYLIDEPEDLVRIPQQ